MLEQLKSWLRKDKKQLHRPRPRIIPRLEVLEDRWMLAGETYPQSQFGNTLLQLYSDAPAATELENRWVQSLNALTADRNKSLQQFINYEFAALSHSPLGQAIERADYWLSQTMGMVREEYDTLLHDIDSLLSTLDKQQTASPPSNSPNTPPNSPAGSNPPISMTPPTAKAPQAANGTTHGTIRPLTSNPPANNLLTNGGFETGDFTGWTQGGNTGYTSVDSGIGDNSTYAAALGPIGSDGTLSQTVATTPGTVYLVSFALLSDGGTPNDFTATFAGQTLQSGTNLAAFPYTTYTYDVTATSASSTLQFDFRDDPGYLDLDNANVSVFNPNAPTAKDDTYTLQHDTTLTVPAAGVLANDTDPHNLSLSAVLVSGPSNGTLNLNSNGSFTYTPTTHWIGSDSFQYYASNGQLPSNTATVTLNVIDNGTISTQPDSYSILHDRVLNVNASTGVLANDGDSDGDSLTATLASGPSYGNVQLNSDGSFTYTPNAGYTGNDSFQYYANDGVQNSTLTSVSINVTDNAPTAINHTYGVPENTTLNVTAADGLFQGASDADGDPLTLSSWTQPSNGSLQVNPDGSFTYTPNNGYTGSDGFQYTVSDGALTSTANVTLNVHASDTAPVANADSYSVERNNEFYANAATGVLANDTDADSDPLTAILVSVPTNGTLSLNSDGSFDYTPNTNFTGTDTFTYEASDGVLNSQPATVTLTVSGSPPIAANQTFTVKENTTLNTPAGALLVDAYNPDNMALTAQDVSQPSNGTVTVHSDGSFTYTPNNGFTGSDTFTYDLTDGSLTSSAATVTILVNASDTVPTASPLSYTVDENNSLTIDSVSGVLSGASDSDGDRLLATLVSGPSNGTLTLNPDGSFTYTPKAAFYGTDSFQYEAFDGTSYSNAATVTLTVTSDVPTANNDTYGVQPNTTLNVPAAGVLANDSDADGLALTADLITGVSNGSLTLNPDGSFSYTPNSGFTGTDSFTYEANNGVANSNVATVTLNVHTSNHPPIANDDAYSTPHNTPLTISGPGVLGNDTDADNDVLTASLVSYPSNGTLTLNSDGSFTYTPNNNFIGSDSFTYQASDGIAYSNTATVTIAVTDNPPSAGDDSYTLLHDQTLTVPASSGVLANDSDPDGDPLTAPLVSAPSNGTLQLHSDGSFTYTPNAHFAGTDSFTYEANDGMMNSSPATVFLDVTDAAPVAADDSYSTPAGQTLTVAASGVLANDNDSDGDSLTAQLMTGPADGTLMLNSDGSFTYTPNAGFTGKDSFTYQATDGIKPSNTATVTITVTNSTTPVANNDEFATGMDEALTIAAPGVLWNDTAPSGKTLTAVLNTEPANGELTLNSNGSFTYTPNEGFTGDDSFTYYASAGGVVSANPATVTIHVANVTLAMPNGQWVPINANDDNGSPITNMIPAVRDYNFQRQLPAADPQLQPLNININNPNQFGFINISIQPAAGSTGQIRLWTDQRKTKQIAPGLYPVMGPNALPATIYVEGVNPTSRTIAGNAIQAPVPDSTITVTYYILLPWLPGGIAPPPVQVGKDQVKVGVTPVTQIFTINNVPVPPNPPVNPATAGRIAFGDNPPGGLNPKSIYWGYQTFGVNPGARNPNAPVPAQFAATFNAQAFNANMPGALHLVQNETITNGGGGAANAWTFAAGGPAAQNWKWLVNGNLIGTNNPILDMAAQQQPQPPYYQAQGVPALGNNAQITSGDSPYASGPALVNWGLAFNPRGPIPVTQVAWTFNFTLYLIWSMPAGGGAAGDVIYTLATRPWSAVFQATANVANSWANTIAAASGVFTPGDFTMSNTNPVVIGPTANQAARIS